MRQMFLLEKLRGMLSVVFVFVFGVALFSLASGANAAYTVPSSGGWDNGYAQTGTQSELSSAPISVVILTLMRWLLYLVGFLAVIAFVISGILYLTAAGDDDKIEKAKTTMIYAIVGVIVALMGLIIINAINTWLGASSATF